MAVTTDTQHMTDLTAKFVFFAPTSLTSLMVMLVMYPPGDEGYLCLSLPAGVWSTPLSS